MMVSFFIYFRFDIILRAYILQFYYAYMHRDPFAIHTNWAANFKIKAHQTNGTNSIKFVLISTFVGNTITLLETRNLKTDCKHCERNIELSRLWTVIHNRIRPNNRTINGKYILQIGALANTHIPERHYTFHVSYMSFRVCATEKWIFALISDEIMPFHPYPFQSECALWFINPKQSFVSFVSPSWFPRQWINKKKDFNLKMQK